MTQAAAIHPRSGWQQEETALLFSAIREAAADGTPLRDVFERVGRQLNRKPNSIRNYYYARIRDMPELAPGKTTFRVFDQEELHLLLRDVLMARGRGESVRACVTRRAGGDRSMMLRYQNKYRSILKNHPEMLMEVAEELRSEGIPCPGNVAACRRYSPVDVPGDVPALPVGWQQQPGAVQAMEGLCAMLRCMEAQTAALRERSEMQKSMDEAPAAAAPSAGEEQEKPAQEMQVPYDRWLKARQEADRLRVEVDLLKIALEEAQKGDGQEEAQSCPAT